MFGYGFGLVWFVGFPESSLKKKKTEQRYKEGTNYVTRSELNNNEIITMIKIANTNPSLIQF